MRREERAACNDVDNGEIQRTTSACSFSPSPLTRRQLNCQVKISQARSESTWNSSTETSVFIYFSRRKKSHQNTRAVQRTHTPKTNDIVLLLHRESFSFVSRWKWVTNTSIDFSLPSQNLFVSPLDAAAAAAAVPIFTENEVTRVAVPLDASRD